MYSGSLCIIAWKCGSVLLKVFWSQLSAFSFCDYDQEVQYITDEKDDKKKKTGFGRKKIAWKIFSLLTVIIIIAKPKVMIWTLSKK